MWKQLLIVGGGAAAGSLVGAVLDEKNRVEGALYGSLGGASLGLVGALLTTSFSSAPDRLTVYGTRVSFFIKQPKKTSKTGKTGYVNATVDAPSSFGWMYDPSGRAWPKCSILIGPYKKRHPTTALLPSRNMARWFGDGYEVKTGDVDLPPRRLATWKLLGEADTIFYDRAGAYADYYKHRFSPHTSFSFDAPKPALLYARGRFLRLELPRGTCLIDERGIVRP